MQRKYLLPSGLPSFKANLHGHTTISDGQWTPERFKEEYQGRGYHVAAITDHNQYRYHRSLNDDGFVCLAAAEMNLNTPEDGPHALGNRRGTYHFNVYDTRPDTRPEGFGLPLPRETWYGDADAINRWLGELEEMGFLCCYNHPSWSLQHAGQYVPLRHLFAMEIYNHGCELDGLYGYAPQAYDEMLAAGQRLYPLATDDNHNSYPAGHPLCDSFGGFVVLYPSALTYGCVVTALRQGDFYASTGPRFQALYAEGSTLMVETSGVEKIYVKTAGRRCLRRVAETGETLYTASFCLEGLEQPFRVDIRDSRGRHAYTRAYTL